MIALALAASFLHSVLAASPSGQSPADTRPPGSIWIEAESGDLVDTHVASDGAGFSGSGYVDGFENQDAAVHFHVPAHSGIWDLILRYRCGGDKGGDVSVNGHKISGMLPASGQDFAVKDIGKVELNEGDNAIAVERGWGYYQLDALELVPASRPPKLGRLSRDPVDPHVTPEARQLYRTLLSQYGKRTFTGQHGLGDAGFVAATTGVAPAIVSWDLIDYSPSRIAHGSHSDTSADDVIRAAHDGHIISVMWHWNAPTDLIDKHYKNDKGEDVDGSWYFGFYTKGTTFDLQQALSDPHSERYGLLLSDIDAIAPQLEALQAAHIPVLWRPLHEAEGGWFWWGAKGPDAFKQLWRLMYDRLTNYHGLHNLIWVYTAGSNPDWYPGDQYVDIVGADQYPDDPTDPLSGMWEDLFKQYDGRKLIALTEYGGVPDVERMAKFGVRWDYFVSWGGDLGPKKVTPEELTRLYHEKRAITIAPPASPASINK